MDKILAAIDEEIARLRQVRSLLAQTKTTTKTTAGKKRGRPKKRTLSADARARIAEAQRKRWAKQKSK